MTGRVKLKGKHKRGKRGSMEEEQQSLKPQADHSMCSCLRREYMRVMNKALKIAHLNHVLV